MADPHPGEWELLLDENDNGVDSQVTAIHAHLIPILTGGHEHPKAKVLYWHARYPTNYTFTTPPDTTPNFMSCLYDPESNEIIQNFIPRWTQTIGDDIDPSKLFCSGHTHLANGLLLVAGGERNQPPWGSNGTKYSFYFDSNELDQAEPRPWKKTGGSSATTMEHGRWYPQLTRLNDGRVVAMSGYPEVPSPDFVVLNPEIYDPDSQQWSELTDTTAEMAVPLYIGAYLIPFGDWKGEIFYDLVAFGPQLDWKIAHRFNPDPPTSTIGTGLEPKINLYENMDALLYYQSNTMILRSRLLI